MELTARSVGESAMHHGPVVMFQSKFYSVTFVFFRRLIFLCALLGKYSVLS